MWQDFKRRIHKFLLRIFPKKVLVESTVEILNTPNTPKIVVGNKNMKKVSNTEQGETLMEDNMEANLNPRDSKKIYRKNIVNIKKLLQFLNKY